MKCKIITVSMVKNEDDIIEAFVRYNCQFVDGMIILDNRSLDGTPTVLRRLVEEGLPLVVFEDTEPGFFQAEKTSHLVQQAIDDYQADLILPLDVDEFLTTASGAENPRNILEKLSPDFLHYARWRIYIPHESDDVLDPCIPRRIKNARHVTPEDLCKVIVPARMWREWDLRLTIGNHDAISLRDSKIRLNKSIHGELVLAHFPIRSLEQIKRKTFTARTICLADHNRGPGESIHMAILFAELKRNRITADNFSRYAKEYLSSFQNKEEQRPITWSGMGRINLLYSTEIPGNWLRNGLENMEYIARESQRIANNDPPSEVTNATPGEAGCKVVERMKDLRDMQTSYSWRLTYPLRLFARMNRVIARMRS